MIFGLTAGQMVKMSELWLDTYPSVPTDPLKTSFSF
jgi:hypothetical protein